MNHDMPKSTWASINTAIKCMNSLNHIDETLYQLDDALSKARIPSAIKVYRAIKIKGDMDLDTLNHKYSNNRGYISTSPLYDSSFAKYDDYNTVIEILVPSGSKGIYIMPLSDYDTAEQEILFGPSNLHYVDIRRGVIDKNGKLKTIVKAILISKEKELRENEQLESSKDDISER